jgi:hypothetical protein
MDVAVGFEGDHEVPFEKDVNHSTMEIVAEVPLCPPG